jgi:integrase/recombinase XerD
MVGFYRVCIIDGILDHSPADYVRRPTVPAESPTLGLGHLQFEALITTARLSTNPNEFALVALLGLRGLRIFKACGASIADLGEEHGHRVLRVRGKGGKVALVPLPPAVARAIDRAVDDRTSRPILRNTLGVRARTSPGTPTASWPRTWPPGHSQPLVALPMSDRRFRRTTDRAGATGCPNGRSGYCV